MFKLKIIKNICVFIFEVILTVSIVVFIASHLITSTILSKEYILHKLDETGYYDQVYVQVQANFEKYIYQSGLEEEVIQNLITEDQIKSDTQKIISNIYDGNEEEIDSEELKHNLLSKIESSLGGIADNQKQAVDDFVNAIEEEYSGTIAHFKYESQINSFYQKTVKYIGVARKVSIVILVGCIAVLGLLNGKEIYKWLISIGTSCFAAGVACLIVNGYIHAKINVEGITFLNNAFSELLRNIVQSILKMIQSKGFTFAISGVLAIFTASLIHTIINRKQEME